MSNLSNIGNLMNLYLEYITPQEPTDASQFLISTTARLLQQEGARNWLPVIVKEIGEDKYEIIGNSFAYAVAEKAGLDRVWCIIAEDTDNAVEISKVLAREKMPKVNLCSASRDDIKAALQYLIEQPGSALKGVNLVVATTRIDEAPRQFWRSFEAIPKLKCGITKGKKLDSLKQVFYLSPEPVKSIQPDESKTATTKRDRKSLQQMTIAQLKSEAKKENVIVSTKMRKSDIIAAILEV